MLVVVRRGAWLHNQRAPLYTARRKVGRTSSLYRVRVGEDVVFELYIRAMTRRQFVKHIVRKVLDLRAVCSGGYFTQIKKRLKKRCRMLHKQRLPW
jgi:hypothetical protein